MFSFGCVNVNIFLRSVHHFHGHFARIVSPVNHMTPSMVVCWLPFTTQSSISTNLENFDYFTQYSNKLYATHALPTYTQITLCRILALAVNASLLEQSNTKTIPEATFIYPHTSLHLETTATSVQLGQTPVLIKVEPAFENFVYCMERIKETDSLSFFVTSFDIYTWICLILAFMLVKLVKSIDKAWNISSMQKRIEVSIIFWNLILDIFLMNLYSSGFTGTLTVPSPDREFASLTELSREGFVLVKVEHFWDPTSRYKARKDHDHEDDIKSALFLDKSSIHTGFLEYFGLVDGNKGFKRFCCIFQWSWAIRNVHTLNQCIAKDGLERKRKCYLGMKTLDPISQYFAFQGPLAGKIGKAFQNLIQSGIYQRWDEEYVSLLHSVDVKDRLKVVSPTKIKNDVEGEYYPLRIEGSMTNIFCIFFIAFSSYTLVFIIECFRNKY